MAHYDPDEQNGAQRWNPAGSSLDAGISRLRMTFFVPGSAASREFLAGYERDHPRPPPDEDDSLFATEAEKTWGRTAELAYELAIKNDLREATGHPDWQAPTIFVYEGAAAGPFVPTDLIFLIQHIDDLVDAIVRWAGMYMIVKATIDYTKERWGAKPFLDDGPATVIGAKAIHDRTQDDSLRFASTAKLAPVERPDWIDQPDAFLVAFRGNDHLWTAVVTAEGEIVDVTSQSLSDDLPTVWTQRDDGERI